MISANHCTVEAFQPEMVITLIDSLLYYPLIHHGKRLPIWPYLQLKYLPCLKINLP